ncbi:MAG: hypothetical protein PHS32_03920 [Rhodoferax sp.]|uniref:hypothetical protein n=1 Tax=Rhodoferax sp. TaxID=50421 RepID=UPI00261F81FA|nr:hypothetical protein [Rhodoferax sp.]MDD5332871.1 hypothetical protein [Rhodoferax sp.]
MTDEGERWIRFLRKYGPLPRNENMYDEHIRRSARRLGVLPITFKHPLEESVLSVFNGTSAPKPVILTGTAGDGKSHLCGKIWQRLGGDASAWASDDIYFRLETAIGERSFTLHVIRDLTALPDQDEQGRYVSKAALLQQLSETVFDPSSDTLFLLAANDGQLIETWRKLGPTGNALRARELFEARLMGDADPEPTAHLHLFNLSVISSATILELALDSLLAHPGWPACISEAKVDGFFGSLCPIRHNYELLQTPLVKSRLAALFRLCDFNELHTPIRRVLMLLANGLLGHPLAKDRLLVPSDVSRIITNGTSYQASLYSNLFGANLGGTKRESLEIFEYLGRFGIGQETTNRVDNILIFGAEDDNLMPYYDVLISADKFYGGTDRYGAARRAYVETPEATVGDRHVFLEMLIEQRRGLFFKIPEAWADELRLWSLTVFAGAGGYLADIARPLFAGERVPRHVVASLVNGLNRIFTGVLVSSDRELLLANFSMNIWATADG